ncbi:hypothetical protein L249_1119 [Ophiocordyceps polyrhachis-furcata BCC 54312]|uniref:Uncharacterized protein n=1 Tax=Ophiocordyceps polyrhachis-furcata BCC 54312 TaxID=1330021 RepID=A0A367LF68_9HYPO|nr:hypothetical protein L249_1119 [Ophiocordyceps polyrhachis-furcata BCC 54312]
MLAFVLSSVLVASGAFIPAGAFPCNNCVHDALAPLNVTHNIALKNCTRVPPVSDHKAVAVNELSEPKAVADPENRSKEEQSLAKEFPSGAARGKKKCGKSPVESQAPVESSPAQPSPQDVAGPQGQPSGDDAAGSQEKPQGPPKQQSPAGPPRKKCKKRPFQESQPPMEPQKKPLSPSEKEPQVKPVRKPCKPAPKQSKSSANNGEQQLVTQPSNNGDGVKPDEGRIEPPKTDNPPAETAQKPEESPVDANGINSNDKAEIAGEQLPTASQEPSPQGPADQGEQPADVPGEPATKPGEPAKKPENPAKEPEPSVKEPEAPAKEPGKPSGKPGSSQGRPGGNITATSHVEYSSSIGVLGCKGVDLSRIAYFPGTPGCDDICVKVTYEGRSVNLLRIDNSGSAPSPDNSGTFDMSCQAYDFLLHGTDNKKSCQTGGRTAMSYETVDPDECKHLLSDGVLPISAPNPNYYVQCANHPTFNQGSLKLALFNINDARCKYGIDEECSCSGVGDPKCRSGLGQGNTRQLQGLEVVDPSYGG